jgi:hypothetical protein
MMTRTTFDTLSSRQINLIDLPCTKNARWIFGNRFQNQHPNLGFQESWKPPWTPQPRGSFAERCEIVDVAIATFQETLAVQQLLLGDAGSGLTRLLTGEALTR